MTCESAQQQLQDSLDQRLSTPLPEAVTDHVSNCRPCQAWQILLEYRPGTYPGSEVRPDFAKRVVQQYQRERRRVSWLRRGSLLAIAASLFIAAFAWLTSHPATVPPQQGNRTEFAQLKSRELLDNMMQELAQLQTQAYQFQPPTWSIPSTFTAWELNEYGDAWTISMPAIKTIGNSLQGAMEPYEMPARVAYSKVKAVIDDPEVKKWVNRFNRPRA